MKISPCLLGFGFLGASLWTSLAKEDPIHFNNFQDTLDENQKILYKGIKRDRLTLYLTGLFFGSLIAVAYLYFYESKNVFNQVCSFVTIAWGFTYFYYMLMPKSTYMVNHLKNQEQNRAWNNIYRDMQFRYIGGFLLGMIAYGLLCYGMIKC